MNHRLPLSGAGRMRSLALLATPWGLIVPGGLLLWLSFPTFLTMHTVWSGPDYSHGYLVLGLTILLVVSELRRESLAPPAPSWAGLACLLGLALVLIAARVTSTQSVELLALPLSWVAVTWAWAGWQNARRLVLPLSYLLVANPLWDVFVEPLRKLTVLVVSMWIRIAGMPAFIEGNLIHVPSGTFEVMGGCAGLRYALVALALAVFTGLFNYRRWQPTAVLILSALALVAIGNWLRVFITVAVGLSPAGWVPTLVRDHHTLFGWIVFVVFMIPLSWVHRKLQTHSRTDPAMPAVARDETVVQGGSLVPYVTCAVLGLTIWFSLSVNRLEPTSAGIVSFENPEIADWTRGEDWQDARLPAIEGAAVLDATWYSDGTARVGASVVTFTDQGQGRDIVSLHNLPLGASVVVVARQTVRVRAVSGATMPFLQLEISEIGGGRRLVWINLRIAGTVTASDLAAKVLQLRGAIQGRRDAQALILTAVCGAGCDEARSSLSRFASAATESFYERADRSVRAEHVHPSAIH